jgi:hypothetical protein
MMFMTSLLHGVNGRRNDCSGSKRPFRVMVFGWRLSALGSLTAARGELLRSGSRLRGGPPLVRGQVDPAVQAEPDPFALQKAALPPRVIQAVIRAQGAALLDHAMARNA